MTRHTIKGKLSCHQDGYGFVIPDEGGDDLFIPARYLRGNLHGDRVVASVEPGRRSGRREGRIMQTLERGFSTLVGRFESDRAGGVVIPDEPRITQLVAIPRGRTGKARNGEVVAVEITAYPSEGGGMSGRIVEVLGRPGDPDTEVLIIARKYGLAMAFPPDVLAEAHSVAREPAQADLEGRTDLRGDLTITIDGETARDFDDAVSVSRLDGDVIRLRVSIADVSHYVKESSSLDREALGRGTSVYFPDRSIPMLPENLSNEICSLNPGRDRLTVTAELHVDREGNVLESFFYPSVIRSDERMTYTAVREILVDGNPDTIARYGHLAADLKTMEELALRLTAKRRQRGSIDFDLPEPEIVLDLQGRIESLARAERNLAHRIIEEFMLAANEAVAAYLAGRDMPCLFRIHEPPDPARLRDFRDFIRAFGFTLRMKGDRVDPPELQRLLKSAEGRPEEKMVNELLLRCMKQARYSAENVGHFGLASPCYLHFTSPIRRYPDLVVHRVLKGVLSGSLKKREKGRIAEVLPGIAEETSRRERTAMEAEREIVDLKRLEYMESRVGEVYDGFDTGVASYGFYVELAELPVEGLVHVTVLGDDYYRLAEKLHSLVGERSGRVYRIGDKVSVRVDAVSREKRRVQFSPTALPGRPAGRKPATPGSAPPTGAARPRPPKKKAVKSLRHRGKKR
ncbi:MAG: ribonuclease R [Geobacteraceae bacterium]|nr:ribonuclease R [Geobacteraceae bacterium]